MKYIKKTSKLIKEYFNILSPDYPRWLDEYIETKRNKANVKTTIYKCYLW